jgi:hypothetical protein
MFVGNKNENINLKNMVVSHPRPQAQARAALTVALVQAVEQLIVIGSFALKECCGWEGNAG